LKSTRQQYHQRIAEVLEAQFPETAEAQPELRAHHFTEAGLTEKAVGSWHKAGQRAIERSAYVEANSHFNKGLEKLQTLSETPQRLQRQVELHIAIGASLFATKGAGAPEVEQTYLHAHHLCQHLDDPHQRFLVLRGLWQYYFVHAELRTAQARGEQLLALAQQAQDPAMLLAAHRALGSTLFFLGAVASAYTHLAQGLRLYDPQQHRAVAFRYGDDAGVNCHNYVARTLWILGYPDQGLARTREVVMLVQQLAHPYSLTLALINASIFHTFRREVRAAQEHAEAALNLATEQGFPYWMAQGAILRGWTLTQQGQAQAGIEQLIQSLRALRATGAKIWRPYFFALLAEAQGIQWEPGAGLTVLAEALTLVNTTGERWYESELHRLKGELLLQQNADNQAEAEVCFHQAIAIAQNQHAKSWELRAATSLARLWQQHGKRQEAYDLLAPVYNWFTEGFDTADLQEAKALLEVLA
jgi:predicted ATPase